MAECFGAAPTSTAEWDRGYDDAEPVRWHRDRFKSLLAKLWQEPSEVMDVCDLTNDEVDECFRRLANEWEQEIQNVSSVLVLTSHPNYREIVRLGWRVVPYLLRDLQTNRRFWFPALHEITGISPFDRSDAGDSERMLEAWVKWGKRKKLI